MSKVFNMVGGGGGPAASIFVTGLSETDTVTATNGSKTLTGKWTQKPNPAFYGLPDGYTQLEYIQSDGASYIYLGSYDDLNVSVSARVAFLNIDDVTHEGIFSMQGGSGYRNCFIGRLNSFFYFTYKNTEVYTSSLNENTVYDITAMKSANAQTFTVDGNLIYSGSDTRTNHSNRKTHIFSTTNDSGTPTNLATASLYHLSIKIGYLNFNLIPCKRNSDSEIGMYDIVNDVFYTNAGTGTFTAGPEVPQTVDGFLIKPIRDFGTWTVTATDGTKTATQDVLVDVITEYEIEMDLTKLWLYRDGDEFEDVTGGWVDDTPNGGWTSVPHIKNEDNLELSKGGSTSSYPECCVFCSNAVDITNYATLHMVVDYKLVNSGTDGVWFGLNSTHPVFLPDNTDYMFKSWDVADETSKEFTFNITSLSGLYYLQAAIIRGAILRIRKAWLE